MHQIAAYCRTHFIRFVAFHGWKGILSVITLVSEGKEDYNIYWATSAAAKVLKSCFNVNQSPFSAFKYSYLCWYIKSIFWMCFGAHVAFRCGGVVLMKSRDPFHKQFFFPQGFVLNSRREHEGLVDQGQLLHRSPQDWVPCLGEDLCWERGLPWSLLELWHTKTSVCLCLFVSVSLVELYIRGRPYSPGSLAQGKSHQHNPGEEACLWA